MFIAAPGRTQKMNNKAGAYENMKFSMHETVAKNAFFWDEKIFFGKRLADILFPGYSQKSIFGFNGFHICFMPESVLYLLLYVKFISKKINIVLIFLISCKRSYWIFSVTMESFL